MKNNLSPILILMCIATLSCRYIMGTPSTGNAKETSLCTPLPDGFSEADLIGTWIGNYFGNIDTLIFQEDHKYKQIYESYTPGYLNFESEWQNWWLEKEMDGYARLHLDGMRRCDGLEEECNDISGGLPGGILVIDPCKYDSFDFPGNEIILYVTGAKGDVPRGILLRQARLAGSDWTFSYRFQK